MTNEVRSPAQHASSQHLAAAAVRQWRLIRGSCTSVYFHYLSRKQVAHINEGVTVDIEILVGEIVRRGQMLPKIPLFPLRVPLNRRACALA